MIGHARLEDVSGAGDKQMASDSRHRGDWHGHKAKYRSSRARTSLHASGDKRPFRRDDARNGQAGADKKAIRCARYLHQRRKEFRTGPEPAARADRFEAAAAEPAGTGALPRAQRHDGRGQGSHRRTSVENRKAQQIRDSAGVFRRRQRAAARRVRQTVRHHAGAAGRLRRNRTRRSRTSSISELPSRAPKASMRQMPKRRAASASGLFFAETNGNQNIGNARSNKYKGSFQTGTSEDQNGRRKWAAIRPAIAAFDPALSARDDKEEARVGQLDHRYNHWTAVRDGLMNAHAEIFPQVPAIVKTLPRSDRPDEAVRTDPDHSRADPVRAEVRQPARLPGFRPDDHGISAQQQHVRLRPGRPGKNLGDLPRNPRCDVAVQCQIRTGACQIQRDQGASKRIEVGRPRCPMLSTGYETEITSGSRDCCRQGENPPGQALAFGAAAPSSPRWPHCCCCRSRPAMPAGCRTCSRARQSRTNRQSRGHAKPAAAPKRAAVRRSLRPPPQAPP